MVRCTMKGLEQLPLPLMRFIRVEGLNLKVREGAHLLHFYGRALLEDFFDM